MKIVEANVSHVDQIAPLFDAYRQFYELDSDLAGAKNYLTQRLSNKESTIFLALNDKDQAVGFTQLYPTFESLNMRRRWVLYDLFVTPEARKLGAAQALMQRAQQLGVDTNAVYIELDTAKDNLKAQALYEKMGYERDTVFCHYVLEVDPLRS